MNIFKYEPEKRTLAFIDAKGSLSGTLMENIKNRQPNIIEKLHQKLLSLPEVKKNDIIEVGNYTFIVVRKNYQSKVKIEELIVPKLEGVYKTTKENFADVVDLFINGGVNLEVYDTSEWE